MEAGSDGVMPRLGEPSAPSDHVFIGRISNLRIDIELADPATPMPTPARQDHRSR